MFALLLTFKKLNNMKKFLFSVAFAFVSALGLAQEGGLAVKAGVNLNKMSGEGRSTDNAFGFHVGVTYDHYFNEVFGIETGLLVDTKGSKYAESTGNVLGLTIPVLAKTKINVETFDVFLVAGPFANIGLMGMQDAKDVKFGNEGINRFTFGLNFGGGVEFGKFIVGAGYDLGLSEVAKDSKTKYHSIKIGVGYRF